MAGGLNLYAYAGNNPVGFSDPFGLKPCKDADGKVIPCPEPQGPPPIPLPDGKNGQPNEWEVKPGSGKRTKWGAKHRVPSERGEQPGASWDPDGHWDVDNVGRKGRRRIEADGTEIADHEGTPIYGPQQVPQVNPSDAAKTVGALTILYWIISVGTRAFPPRNFIPVP